MKRILWVAYYHAMVVYPCFIALTALAFYPMVQSPLRMPRSQPLIHFLRHRPIMKSTPASNDPRSRSLSSLTSRCEPALSDILHEQTPLFRIPPRLLRDVSYISTFEHRPDFLQPTLINSIFMPTHAFPQHVIVLIAASTIFKATLAHVEIFVIADPTMV